MCYKSWISVWDYIKPVSTRLKKKGNQAHLDPFEKPNWAQPRFVSKLTLESQNSQGSHRGACVECEGHRQKEDVSAVQGCICWVPREAVPLNTERCTSGKEKTSSSPTAWHPYCPVPGGNRPSFRGHCSGTPTVGSAHGEVMLLAPIHKCSSLSAERLSTTMFWS